MRNLLCVLLLTAAPLLGAGRFEQEPETRNLSPFSELSAAQGITVVLTPGPKPMAIIHTGGNITAKDVITEVSGQRLRVSFRDEPRGKASVEVEVIYQTLTELKASSGARISGTVALLGDDCLLKASSAGRIQVPLKVNKVQLEASSSGEISSQLTAQAVYCKGSSSGSLDLSGTTQRLVADISSAGTLRARDLETQTAIVEASSGSQATLWATQRVEIEASSGALVNYYGNPETFLKARSGALIKHKQ